MHSVYENLKYFQWKIFKCKGSCIGNVKGCFSFHRVPSSPRAYLIHLPRRQRVTYPLQQSCIHLLLTRSIWFREQILPWWSVTFLIKPVEIYGNRITRGYAVWNRSMERNSVSGFYVCAPGRLPVPCETIPPIRIHRFKHFHLIP